MSFAIMIDGLTLINAENVVSISKKDRFVDMYDVKLVDGTTHHLPENRVESLIEHFGFKLDDFDS